MQVSTYQQQEMGAKNQVNLGEIIGQIGSINDSEETQAD